MSLKRRVPPVVLPDISETPEEEKIFSGEPIGGADSEAPAAALSLFCRRQFPHSRRKAYSPITAADFFGIPQISLNSFSANISRRACKDSISLFTPQLIILIEFAALSPEFFKKIKAFSFFLRIYIMEYKIF